MIKVHTLKVDIAITSTVPTIRFSQADINTNVFKFIIKKSGLDYDLGGHLVKMFVKKPNGIVTQMDITDVQGNNAILVLGQGVTNTPGAYVAELHITQADKTVAVCQFPYHVAKSISDLYAPIPDSQVTIIEDLSNKVLGFRSDLEAAKTNEVGTVFPTLGERLNDKYGYKWDDGLNMWVRYFFKNGAMMTQKKINNVWTDI